VVLEQLAPELTAAVAAHLLDQGQLAAMELHQTGELPQQAAGMAVTAELDRQGMDLLE